MDNQAMPPEIAKAVVKVMGEVKKLGKDTRNPHGGYNYVSVDQFFDQIGQLMHVAGIFVVVNESESETAIRETGNGRSSAWLTCAYDIYIYHESGAAYGPVKRSIQVSASGPQSYGSAISFVEKYFLRSLFKIPTGEQDADQGAQEGLPARTRKVAPPPPPKPAANDTTLEASQATRDAMLDELTAIFSDDELASWFARSEPAIDKLLEADKQILRDAYSDTKQALKGKVAA